MSWKAQRGNSNDSAVDEVDGQSKVAAALTLGKRPATCRIGGKIENRTGLVERVKSRSHRRTNLGQSRSSK